MPFSEKLLRLMLLENVSNVKLAKSINVDPSLVSRWKKGERVPTRDSEHLLALATYFAEGAKAEYQIRQIFEMTDKAFSIHNNPSTSFMADAIYDWLCVPADNRAMMDSFIKHLSGFGENDDHSSVPAPSISGSSLSGNGRVFIDSNGRRAAIMALFSMMEQFEKYGEILIFSDENLDWLTGDPEFYRRFLLTFNRLVKHGIRVKLMYPYRRGRANFGDFVEAWLPLYVSGCVQPFCCAKYRDNIFQQFLMAVPGVGAILSQSVAGSKNIPSVLITDTAGVNAVLGEFDTLLDMCVPGMDICQSQDAIFTAEKMKDYWSSIGSIFYIGSVLPMVTAPGHFVYDVIRLANLDGPAARTIACSLKDRADRFIASLRENTCVAMAPLSKPEDVLAGKVTLSNSSMFFGQEIKYTPEYYIKHLEHLAGIMNKYSNYRFQVIDDWDTNLLIMAKVGAGTIISKTSAPPLTFFTEYALYPEITETLYDYLERLYEKIPAEKKTRKYNLYRIESLIKELKNGI